MLKKIRLGLAPGLVLIAAFLFVVDGVIPAPLEPRPAAVATVEEAPETVRRAANADMGIASGTGRNRLGLGDASGALAARLVPDGPAQRAGLRHGDVVTAVDRKATKDAR